MLYIILLFIHIVGDCFIYWLIFAIWIDWMLFIFATSNLNVCIFASILVQFLKYSCWWYIYFHIVDKFYIHFSIYIYIVSDFPYKLSTVGSQTSLDILFICFVIISSYILFFYSILRNFRWYCRWMEIIFDLSSHQHISLHYSV